MTRERWQTRLDGRGSKRHNKTCSLARFQDCGRGKSWNFVNLYTKSWWWTDKFGDELFNSKSCNMKVSLQIIDNNGRLYMLLYKLNYTSYIVQVKLFKLYYSNFRVYNLIHCTLIPRDTIFWINRSFLGPNNSQTDRDVFARHQGSLHIRFEDPIPRIDLFPNFYSQFKKLNHIIRKWNPKSF